MIDSEWFRRACADLHGRRAFGLRLGWAGGRAMDGSLDVSIECARVPSSMVDGVACSALCVVSRTEALYRFPGVAAFHICADRIVIEPAAGTDEAAIGALLGGPVIAALLCLRGEFVLSASAVLMRDGSAALFCGPSTSGKSTLAAALGARGHSVLADDIAVLRFDEQGGAWLEPGLAPPLVGRAGLTCLAVLDEGEALTPLRSGVDKYRVDVPIGSEPVPVGQIYSLNLDDGHQLTRTTLKGLNRVKALLDACYWPAFVEGCGRQREYMAQAFRLAGAHTVHHIIRPQQGDTLLAMLGLLDAECA